MTPEPRPQDIEVVRRELTQARALWSKGECAQAVRRVQRAAQLALEAEQDARGAELADAATRLGSVGALPGKKNVVPPPLPIEHDIDVAWDDGSIENSEVRTVGGRNAAAPGNAPSDSWFPEAIRVWVGPRGEVELASSGKRRPNDYVEAILVASSPAAGLAGRFQNRTAGAAAGGKKR